MRPPQSFHADLSIFTEPLRSSIILLLRAHSCPRFEGTFSKQIRAEKRALSYSRHDGVCETDELEAVMLGSSSPSELLDEKGKLRSTLRIRGVPDRS